MQAERNSKKEKDSGTINIRSLKKIVTIMNRAKLTELNIEQDNFKIHLKKGGELMPAMAAPIMPPMMTPPSGVMPAVAAVAAPAAAPAAAAEETDGHVIKSPMVGTFYRSPSPEAAPFVEVGHAVEENTVVCIIEAMKLMNEIKAEMKGKIKKILVENAQAVEYGQPLFLVERN